MRRFGIAPIVLGLALAVFIVLTWIYVGGTFVIIVFLPTVVAYVAWLNTTYPHPVRSQHVIIVFLFAIVVQFIHLSEEFFNRFWDYYNVMFAPPIPWDERFFTALFIIAFPLLFVLGAIGLLTRNPFGNYVVWWVRPRPQYGQLRGPPGLPIAVRRVRPRSRDCATARRDVGAATAGPGDPPP